MNKSTILSIVGFVLTLVASAISSEGSRLETEEYVNKAVAKALEKKG